MQRRFIVNPCVDRSASLTGDASAIFVIWLENTNAVHGYKKSEPSAYLLKVRISHVWWCCPESDRGIKALQTLAFPVSASPHFHDTRLRSANACICSRSSPQAVPLATAPSYGLHPCLGCSPEASVRSRRLPPPGCPRRRFRRRFPAGWLHSRHGRSFLRPASRFLH